MTPERFARLRQVLDARQPDLTVLMDNVHKTHNFSAVLRSCDAVGVFEAHAVWPDPRLKPNHMTSGGAGKWVQVRTHASIVSAVSALKATGFRILAAHLSAQAVDYRELDYTRPSAVLLGSELLGVSEGAGRMADTHLAIPMQGMVESLNVSVAAATVLFEAQRQRLEAGLYRARRLDPQLYQRTLFEWAHPEVADYCRRHGHPYPALDEAGDIVEEFR